MPEPKGPRGKSGNIRPSEPKNLATDLIPTNPLSARKAFIQVALLFGIPVLLLLVTKVILKQFFPSLGY